VEVDAEVGTEMGNVLIPTLNILVIDVPSPYPIAINAVATTPATTVELCLPAINTDTTTAATAPASTDKMQLFQAAESQ
jgi:hypothetical protein